ncbi:hypothetical protein IJD34_01890 [bacterium]|nr:hypothetical protein [bacterium]
MKKLLLTTILMTALTCVQANASMVMIDYFGETLVTPNNIERTLIVNSDDGRVYNIALRPLEDAIVSADGKTSIPLEYLFINNTKEDVYLKYNEYSNILWGTTMDGIPRNMTAKIKNYGIVPSGIYNINFEIQATDIETGDIACVSSFNLQFIVPVVHELNTYSENPRINISAENVFKKNIKVPNESSPMIYIRSNTDWILSLDTTDFANAPAQYYVRTTAASSKVTNRLTEQALVTPGREIILARGKAPAENEFVAVEFSVENPSGDPIPAGNYTNTIKYILRDGEVE